MDDEEFFFKLKWSTEFVGGPYDGLRIAFETYAMPNEILLGDAYYQLDADRGPDVIRSTKDRYRWKD